MLSGPMASMAYFCSGKQPCHSRYNIPSRSVHKVVFQASHLRFAYNRIATHPVLVYARALGYEALRGISTPTKGRQGYSAEQALQ